MIRFDPDNEDHRLVLEMITNEGRGKPFDVVGLLVADGWERITAMKLVEMAIKERDGRS